jgi:hypothetical protein
MTGVVNIPKLDECDLFTPRDKATNYITIVTEIVLEFRFSNVSTKLPDVERRGVAHMKLEPESGIDEDDENTKLKIFDSQIYMSQRLHVGLT